MLFDPYFKPIKPIAPNFHETRQTLPPRSAFPLISNSLANFNLESSVSPQFSLFLLSAPTSRHPPVTLSDPLMSWVNEAHWSTGGLRFDVNNLPADRETLFNIKNPSPVSEVRSCFSKLDGEIIAGSKKVALVSPPPAPVTNKRRRYMALSDDDVEDGEGIEIGDRRARRRLVKKLEDDFDRVASENERSGVSETGNEGGNGRSEGSYNDDAVLTLVETVNKSNSNVKNNENQGNEDTISGSEIRTSPRLSKREDDQP